MVIKCVTQSCRQSLGLLIKPKGDFKKNEDISLIQYKMEAESLTMTVYVLKFCF